MFLVNAVSVLCPWSRLYIGVILVCATDRCTIYTIAREVAGNRLNRCASIGLWQLRPDFHRSPIHHTVKVFAFFAILRPHGSSQWTALYFASNDVIILIRSWRRGLVWLNFPVQDQPRRSPAHPLCSRRDVYQCQMCDTVAAMLSLSCVIHRHYSISAWSIGFEICSGFEF